MSEVILRVETIIRNGLSKDHLTSKGTRIISNTPVVPLEEKNDKTSFTTVFMELFVDLKTNSLFVINAKVTDIIQLNRFDRNTLILKTLTNSTYVLQLTIVVNIPNIT